MDPPVLDKTLQFYYAVRYGNLRPCVHGLLRRNRTPSAVATNGEPSSIEVESPSSFSFQHTTVNALRKHVDEIRDIRVFLSSPFGGMEAERTLFISRYVPELRSMCESHGVGINFVDLRWGISDAMCSHNLIVHTCLKAVEQSNVFVGMMGARYGSCMSLPTQQCWLGPSLDVAAKEFSWLDAYRDRSITELEFQQAFLLAASNAPSPPGLSPPHHAPTAPSLLPPTCSLASTRHPTSSAPNASLGPYSHAQPLLSRSRPSRCPQTQTTSCSLVLFRSEDYDRCQYESLSLVDASEANKWKIENDECKALYSRLKAAVDDAATKGFVHVVHNYSTPTHAAQTIHRALCDLLNRVLPTKPPQSEFHHTHLAFAQSRSLLYVTDAAVTERLNSFVEHDTTSTMFVVTGASGSGKSSLLAHIALSCSRPSIRFLHFIGCNSGSKFVDVLLARVVTELAGECGLAAGEVERLHALPLSLRLAALLDLCTTRCAPEERILILLDAVNELDNEYCEGLDSLPRELTWLPTTLPPNVQVLVSSTDTSPCAAVLLQRAHHHSTHVRHLGLQPLGHDQRAAIVRRVLAYHNKHGDDAFVARSCVSPQCASPMYLTVFLQEVVTFGFYEGLDSHISRLLTAQSVPELLQMTFARIESVFSSNTETTTFSSVMSSISSVDAVNDDSFVARALRLLWTSREGLSETELVELLRLDEYSGVVRPHEMLSLLHALHPLVARRAGLFNFSHDYVRQAVEKRYVAFGGLTDSVTGPQAALVRNRVVELHALLARYFQVQQQRVSKTSFSNANSHRALRESLFHQRRAALTPSVTVAVRVRPILTTDVSRGDIQAVWTRGHEVMVIDQLMQQPLIYDFDFAFDTESTQQMIFENIGEAVVLRQVLDGFNVSVLAYGQTGTGKTHTMFGEGVGEHAGLVPRVCHVLLSRLALAKATHVETHVSCLEVYRDKIYDLLSCEEAKPVLRLREHPDRGYYVHGRSILPVRSYEGVSMAISRAYQLRRQAATLINSRSSRSHCVFTLTVAQSFSEGRTLRSTVNLVDLAGSERARTRAADASAEEVLDGISANKSLSVLNKCISALADGADCQRHVHVPYRESTLTALLKDSLGGTAKTVLLAMVSPCASDYSETLCTLRYAHRAKLIVQKLSSGTKEELLAAMLAEQMQESQFSRESSAISELSNLDRSHSAPSTAALSEVAEEIAALDEDQVEKAEEVLEDEDQEEKAEEEIEDEASPRFTVSPKALKNGGKEDAEAMHDTSILEAEEETLPAPASTSKQRKKEAKAKSPQSPPQMVDKSGGGSDDYGSRRSSISSIDDLETGVSSRIHGQKLFLEKARQAAEEAQVGAVEVEPSALKSMLANAGGSDLVKGKGARKNSVSSVLSSLAAPFTKKKAPAPVTAKPARLKPDEMIQKSTTALSKGGAEAIEYLTGVKQQPSPRSMKAEAAPFGSSSSVSQPAIASSTSRVPGPKVKPRPIGAEKQLAVGTAAVPAKKRGDPQVTGVGTAPAPPPPPSTAAVSKKSVPPSKLGAPAAASARRAAPPSEPAAAPAVSKPMARPSKLGTRVPLSPPAAPASSSQAPSLGTPAPSTQPSSLGKARNTAAWMSESLGALLAADSATEHAVPRGPSSSQPQPSTSPSYPRADSETQALASSTSPQATATTPARPGPASTALSQQELRQPSLGRTVSAPVKGPALSRMSAEERAVYLSRHGPHAPLQP